MTTKPPYSPSVAAWPTNVFDECETLTRRASQIARLASAAATLHQRELASTLFGIADEMDLAASAIRDHMSARSQAEYRQAVESSGNILRTALAVATSRP